MAGDLAHMEVRRGICRHRVDFATVPVYLCTLICIVYIVAQLYSSNVNSLAQNDAFLVLNYGGLR
jgi:hypothetical protein